MPSRYFSVEFRDLSFERQQELITDVKEELLEKWQEEGNGIMHKNWAVAPNTWQEAYCREYAIEYQMWSDLEEDSEEFQKFDWKSAVEEKAEEEAEDLCYKSFHHLEVEVEL